MRTQLSRVTTLACTAILFAGACGEAPTGTASEIEAPQFAKPGTTADYVPLTVVFRDFAADAVSSDGLGQYAGVFRETGSFITSAYSQGRDYYFAFPFDPDLSFPADSLYAGYVSTGAPGALGATDIYRMAVGTETQPTSGVVWWKTVNTEGRKDIVTTWFLYFGIDCALGEEPDRRFVATHPTANSWTLSGPDNGNKPILCRSALKGEKGLQTVGEFDMPFGLTMTLVP